MTRESAIHDRDVRFLRDETRLLFRVNFKKGKKKKKCKNKKEKQSGETMECNEISRHDIEYSRDFVYLCIERNSRNNDRLS